MADISKVVLPSGDEYDIKDASVPAWAKESTKPTYTASEVGAAAIAVSFTTGDGTTSATVSNSAITANHICVGCSAEANAANFSSNISFSTSAGSVTASYTKRTSLSVTFTAYFIEQA